MLGLEEAQRRLLHRAAPLPAETVSIDACHGRVVARDISANRSQPAADLSIMDGYAVAGPGPWTIVGEARAGRAFDRSIGAGEATRVSTGAPVPGGTTRVLPMEAGAARGRSLEPTAETHEAYIRPAGFDFVEGRIVLSAGQRIGAAQLALLRMAGTGNVPCHSIPRVAIIECGDELVSDPTSATGMSIPAANGAMVAAMARSAGAHAEIFGPVPDRLAAVVAALDDTAGHDCVITIGGASVGLHDLVKPALEAVGADLDFWRVAVKPGKPMLVARRGRQTIIGLPGNPASSFVTAFLFAVPFLKALQGCNRVFPASIPLPLAAPLPEGGDRREFVRATFADGQADPIMERDSSALLALAAADLLIDRPANAPPAEAGDTAMCFGLDAFGPA